MIASLFTLLLYSFPLARQHFCPSMWWVESAIHHFRMWYQIPPNKLPPRNAIAIHRHTRRPLIALIRTSFCLLLSPHNRQNIFISNSLSFALMRCEIPPPIPMAHYLFNSFRLNAGERQIRTAKFVLWLFCWRLWSLKLLPRFDCYHGQFNGESWREKLVFLLDGFSSLRCSDGSSSFIYLITLSTVVLWCLALFKDGNYFHLEVQWVWWSLALSLRPCSSSREQSGLL